MCPVRAGSTRSDGLGAAGEAQPPDGSRLPPECDFFPQPAARLCWGSQGPHLALGGGAAPWRCCAAGSRAAWLPPTLHHVQVSCHVVFQTMKQPRFVQHPHGVKPLLPGTDCTSDVSNASCLDGPKSAAPCHGGGCLRWR